MTEIIDVKELAKRLSISQRTVWRMIERGEIPYLQVGRRIRFHMPDILRALSKNNGQPHAEG